MTETYSITDLAQEFDVTTRTIRFYEDQGLLAPKRRGQTRIYGPRDRTRLKLILRGKRLGFSLGEVAEMVLLYDSDPGEIGQLHLFLDKIRERRNGLERNHFDRLVHFLWGFLMTYPLREIVIRVSLVRGFWAFLLPFLVVVSTSTLFELIEWLAAVIFGGDLGIAYLGTQGDVWDAQKDMAMALVGSLVASIIIAIVVAALNRDFAREWSESLRVKRKEPLGEYEIERLRARKG